MPATVALIGLTHPHSRMYLEMLDATEEVGAIVLCDADEVVLRDIAARYPKAVAVCATLDEALAHPGLTHALVALPNDQTPDALVQVIEAGIGVFTEKPGARSVAEFLPVLAALERRPVPFAMAYMNRWQPTLRQMRDLYVGGAIGALRSVELRMVTTQVRLRDPQHWLFKREIAAAENPEAKLQEKVDEYQEKFATPYRAAHRGFVDEVILPSQTRQKLIRAFKMLENKVDTMPRKKHGNIPL